MTLRCVLAAFALLGLACARPCPAGSANEDGVCFPTRTGADSAPPGGDTGSDTGGDSGTAGEEV